MPPDLDLDVGCSIVFEAIDPTDGSAVSGVLIGNALIRVDATISDTTRLSAGPFMLVPGPEA
jgi:hypothetical protein